MNVVSFHTVAEGERLVGSVSAVEVGFAVEQVWNPSPSVRHRTEPYPVPVALDIGIRGNEATGAKFSPPPFAVVVSGAGRQALVAVVADAGYHLWNQVLFSATGRGVEVTVDLEGHSDPATVAPHVRLVVIPGEPGETPLDLLARGLRATYPEAVAGAPCPDWWRRPIYCGWGDQVAVSMWLEGAGPEPRALAYCTQGLYDRWLRRLQLAEVPVGTVIIDAGWGPAGTLAPDPERWPDLAGFIRRQHQAGRRVLLWLGTWVWDGLPDEWCVFADDVKLTADPTHPDYRAYLRRQVQRLIGPDGLDADGFKIDQLSHSPSERHPRGGAQFGRIVSLKQPLRRPLRLAGPGWGCELLHQLQHDVYTAAKAVKPDALITSSTVHPYFHDCLDMVRLHDMGCVAPDIFAAMGARADLGRAALPGKLIDTDDWIHTDYALWLRYTRGSGAIGVPCLFYAERFLANWRTDPATVPIRLADLRRLAGAWQAYCHQATGQHGQPGRALP